ncbi:TIGR00725 family protein [Actinoallomurus sp. NBC_01490]|uniref:TIGR00725 family protein n=1 Tax=Actinoallomurus sp. NBC_01490 TaxID=2903557 RepID=UPI002E2EF748|nr:TIGR00725 family protein [Actinoallomurus sp. NBC_01490]
MELREVPHRSRRHGRGTLRAAGRARHRRGRPGHREGAALIQVAVCGPADCTEAERRAAHEVGRLLAARGAVVLCGGYGGVMGAVTEGARSAGGLVVGVLSGADRAEAHPGLSAAIATGMGQARNALIVGSADAVIAVGGSWGTLSEVAHALRRGTVPVVQLGGWRLHDTDGAPVPGPVEAASPEEAVALTGLWP